MTPAALIQEALADGVSLSLSPAGTIKAAGATAAVDRWLPVIREHKPEILAALALTDADYDDPALAPFDAAYRRKAAAEPGYDATVQARYCCECANLSADKRCLAWELLGAPEGWRPSDKRPRRCRGFAPVTDHRSPITGQAFEEAAIAREAEDLKESFEERAAILEYDAGMPRPEAELEAARITATLARNRGYQWASLREALAAYPVLASQVPATPGTVDALPLRGGYGGRAQGPPCGEAGGVRRRA